MNRIVKKHYPVNKLPDDLKSGLPEVGWVDITITSDERRVVAGALSSLIGTGANVHGDEAAVIEHITALRDDR